MAERKVLNKYFPADFDPAKLPRRRMPKNQQIKVRTMLPMSIRCNKCGNYISHGTKFNSRKEIVEETYLGILRHRLYLKCTQCSSEIAITTDPQNDDYCVESGAVRNFERTGQVVEDKGDSMKSSENRMRDSKRNMKIDSALYELKSMKSGHESVTVDAMLEALKQSHKAEDEDRAIIKSNIQFSCEKKRKMKISEEVSVMKTSKLTKSRNGVRLLCQQYDNEEE